MENEIIESEAGEFSLEKQSKYNSSLHQISRISGLKTEAHSHAEKMEWDKYKIILDRIWIELAAQTKDHTEVEAIRKEINEIRGIKTGFNPNEMNIEDHPDLRIKEKQKYAKLKRALEKYEICLRTIENKLGLGMAYRSESEESID